MANWDNPTLTSLYSDVISELKARDVEAATLFEGASPTNTPTNAKRYNSTLDRFEYWDGAAWQNLPLLVTALTGTLTVPNGGTGLTTIPAGRILYGNDASAIATSANLTYDGTTFSVLGSPSGNPFRAGATSSGDCVALSGMAAGSGAIIAGLNSAMTDYEPLWITAETFTIQLRTGVGTVANRLTLSSAGDMVVTGGISSASLSLTSALTVSNGGTGATSLTGYLKGNGTSAFTASATVPVGDISGTLSVPKGGTGLSTIPSDRILYGNNTSAVSTSANLTYDGTTLRALGAPSGNTFQVGATGSGDSVLLSGLAAGSGAVIAGLNSAMADYEPLKILSEQLSIDLRTSFGISTNMGKFSSDILSWNPLASGLELSALTNYAVVRLKSPNNKSLFVSSSDTANYIYGTGNIPLIFGTNNAEKMRLTAAGDLGIGTSNPSSFMAGTTGLAISTQGPGLAFNDTNTGKTYLVYGASNSLKLYEPSIAQPIIDINPGGKVLLGVGGGTAAARLHIKDTSEQLRVGFDGSNYGTFAVASDGTTNITSSSAASDTKAGVGIGRASFAPNNLSLLLAGESTSSYTADQAGAVVRFNGANVIWGDLGFHPKDGSGVFHFKRTGSSYGGGGYSGIRAGTIYSMYDASNYLAIQVDAGGRATFTHSGTNPAWNFSGDSALVTPKHSINNNNANARGAYAEYQTQGITRGYIGALKHGSSGDVLFNGETADGFGISAQSVLEMGIWATGLMRLTTGGLAIGSLFNPSAALHVIKTTEQLRLGYDASNYLAVQVDGLGSTTVTHSGSYPYWIFNGDSASTQAKIILNNNNANARGAISEYRTENVSRGRIGALKHGTAGDVLFTGETADGFGIRAETVLQMGIGDSLKFSMDSSSTRFFNADFRIDQTPAGSAGSATGTYMTINLNGTNYKVALLANA